MNSLRTAVWPILFLQLPGPVSLLFVRISWCQCSWLLLLVFVTVSFVSACIPRSTHTSPLPSHGSLFGSACRFSFVNLKLGSLICVNWIKFVQGSPAIHSKITPALDTDFDVSKLVAISVSIPTLTWVTVLLYTLSGPLFSVPLSFKQCLCDSRYWLVHCDWGSRIKTLIYDFFLRSNWTEKTSFLLWRKCFSNEVPEKYRPPFISSINYHVL